MASSVLVRTDDTMQVLLFAHEADAKRFIGFCHDYQTDSGAGNGYSAYWVCEDTPHDESEREARATGTAFTRQLELPRVELMARTIARARLCDLGSRLMPTLTYGCDERGITSFVVCNMPVRQRPEVGAMCRCVEVSQVPPELALAYGRVTEVITDEVVMTIMGSAPIKTCTVPVRAVMKVPDWTPKPEDAQAWQ